MSALAFIYTDPQSRPESFTGQLMPGATLKFFLSGTLVPAPVYADGQLLNQFNGAVIADGTGTFPVIYLDATVLYRVQKYDNLGNLMKDTDPLNTLSLNLSVTPAVSVLGNPGSTSAPTISIPATTDGQVLVRENGILVWTTNLSLGTTYAFNGPVTITSANSAPALTVTGPPSAFNSILVTSRRPNPNVGAPTGDVAVTASASTINNVSSGPTYALNDMVNNTIYCLQASGGQFELWQTVLGISNQVLVSNANRGLVLNTPASGTTLTVNTITNNNATTWTDGTHVAQLQVTNSAGNEIQFGVNSAHALSFFTSGVTRGNISSAGSWTINAPVGAFNSLNITGQTGAVPLQLTPASGTSPMIFANSGLSGSAFAIFGTNYYTTGSQTATFSATNKPGTGTTAPAQWLQITLGVTPYYIPCWQ